MEPSTSPAILPTRRPISPAIGRRIVAVSRSTFLKRRLPDALQQREGRSQRHSGNGGEGRGAVDRGLELGIQGNRGRVSRVRRGTCCGHEDARGGIDGEV